MKFTFNYKLFQHAMKCVGVDKMDASLVKSYNGCFQIEMYMLIICTGVVFKVRDCLQCMQSFSFMYKLVLK